MVHNPLGEQVNNLRSSSVILHRVQLQHRHTHHITSEIIFSFYFLKYAGKTPFRMWGINTFEAAEL